MSWSPQQYFKTGQRQRCPQCDSIVDQEAVNMKEGVALCSACGTLARLSELVFRDRSIEELVKNPPARCSLQDHGGLWVATVSTRSPGGFIVSLGASLFWNGIVSVFVVIAVGGLWANLIGPLPDWFPAVQNGYPQMNDGPMTLGMTLFLCLFLTPFVLVGAAMILAAAASLWGKVEVVVDKFDSYVTSGVGSFRLKRRFVSGEVTSVSLVQSGWKSDDGRSQLIEIDSNRLVRFGTGLTEAEMHWLKAILEIRFGVNSRSISVS